MAQGCYHQTLLAPRPVPSPAASTRRIGNAIPCLHDLFDLSDKPVQNSQHVHILNSKHYWKDPKVATWPI
jgi:hypothetical protein